MRRATPRRWPVPPVVWAALTYVLIGTVALWPALRPGRTLVPADGLTIVTPFSALPTAQEPHNLQLSDATFQFFPWFQFVAEGMRDGQIRQWNPYLLAGVPVSPNGNVSPYYPPSWLGAAMSPFDAYDLFVLLHLAIGALGVYLLGRVAGAGPVPAWVAGLLAFAAAFWVHWSTHLVHLAGMVWVPWVLAAAWWLLEAPSRRRAAALAAVVGLWLLGGSPQYVYYGGLALGASVVAVLVGRRVRGGGALLKPAVAFALAMGLGAVLAAPVLLPTLATSGRVVRSREPEPPTAHVPRREAIRALVPDATGNPADYVFVGSNDELRMDSPFVGVTGLLLAVAGAAGAGLTRKWRVLLVAGAATAIVLAFTGFPHRVLYEVLPGYDRFRASPRWLFLLPAFALPLAALGLQDLLAGDRRARLALSGAAAAATVAVGGWFLWQQSQEGAPVSYLRNRAVLAVALAGAVAGANWLVRSRPQLVVAVVVACALVEVGFHTPRWYPRVAKATAFPDTAVSDLARERGGRIVTVGERETFPPFAPDVAMVFDVADAGGLSVLFPRDYDRFLRLIDDYGRFAEEFNAAPSLARGDQLSSPLLDALDVRTVLAERDVPVPPEYRRLVPDEVEPWAYGRRASGGAMVVPVARPATAEEMWAAVGAPGWAPAASAAVVGLRQEVKGSGGRATGGPLSSDRERWEVDTPAGGFVRIGSRWDPGWSAKVDGARAPVLRADGVFRGVVVPPGQHTVVFSYRNPEEMRGRLLGGVAVVVLLVLLVPAPEIPRSRQPIRGRRRLKRQGG